MNTVIALDKKDIHAISDVASHIIVMQEKYLPLTIAGVEDTAGFEAVHAARQDVKKKRIAVEETRKKLKSDVIQFGRMVDGEAKRITDMLTPIERHLQNEEDNYIAAKAAAKKAKEEAARAKLQSRVDELQEVQATFTLAAVEKMTDDEFQSFLADATAKHQDRLAAEIAAEIERAKAEAEAARLRAEEEARLAAEREAKEADIRAEQARLAEERARQEAAMAAERERLAEERRAHLEMVAKARAEHEAMVAAREAEARKIQEEQRALERQREAIERAEFERQARINAEEEARQRLAEEQRRIEEARLEAIRLKKEEAAFLESIKPDMQKVKEYVGRVIQTVNDHPFVECEELDVAIEDFVRQVCDLGQKLVRWPNE